MTRDVWILYHKSSGIQPDVIGANKDAALMRAYVLSKCGAELTERELRAMNEYAADHKAAADWLASIGYSVIPAKIKWEEPEERR